jgi:hypothetical protein
MRAAGLEELSSALALSGLNTNTTIIEITINSVAQRGKRFIEMPYLSISRIL